MIPYSEICEKLKKSDPILKKIIEQTESIEPSIEVDIYRSLLNSIVSQQLSTKVAEIIWLRFLGLFSDGYPDPNKVIALSTADLRSVGLSGQKSNYIQNVATFSQEEDMSLEFLLEMSDEEIIKYLTAIKGVGKWTVQMILMFPMDRPDVLPVDDLGIQTKMKKYYPISEEKKQMKLDMEKVAESWKPYRSLACKYLWKSKEIQF